MSHATGLIAVLCLPAMALGAEDIRVERIYGPKQPCKYKHPASITQLDNGDLFVTYYGGGGEYELDTAVWGGRLAKGTSRWTEPKIIADTPYRSEGNSVVWQGPDGIVWLYYLTRYGATWSTSRIKAKISTDGAKTWSDPIMVAIEKGMMVRSHPIALADGKHLIPIYHETGHDREIVGADSTSLFLIYDPAKHTWTETNRIRSRIGNIQPAVSAVTDKYLVCYCRRGGGYGPTKDGWLVRSESRDGGKTWSPGKETTFPNPNSAVDFIKLRSGNLLLVYNDSMDDRTPLTVAISTDGDKTYAYKRDIMTGKGPFAYPVAIQTEDGKIHVVFTSHDRTVVNRATFEESAIVRDASRRQ